MAWESGPSESSYWARIGIFLDSIVVLAAAFRLS